MADGFDPGAMSRRDLRRLIGELWGDSRCERVAPAVLEAAIAADAKSIDRMVLTAYLRHFPSRHPAFEPLRKASALTASRRDWPWHARGETWLLWDAQAGPKQVAAALLEQDEPAAVLRAAGLDGDLAHGAFVGEAIEAACEHVARLDGNAAQALGQRLISLFDTMAIAGHDAMLAWALLAPWHSAKPDKAHVQAVSRLLSDRIGDPRLAQARWVTLEAELTARGRALSGSIAATLRHWLTEATVRAFFAIVRQTTDRADQWDAREAFWLAYLDQGAIREAWFAFGRRAEARAGVLAREEDVRYGRVSGGADPSHSALLMTIGDMRVAEWSHNGSCRFWPDLHTGTTSLSSRRMAAPRLYEPEYDGNRLRTMDGPRAFERLSHVSGWQRNFAAVIHRHTGLAHPTWGTGR
jgi:hypothetical protein